MNSDEHLRRAQWQGAQMLSEHQLLAEDYWDAGRGARWLIGQQDTGHARCEIIAGIFGSLVVHGDFDTARFAQYSDRSDAWSRLRWMADCTDVGYYVAQKARIGMGVGLMGDCYNQEVAEHDLATWEHQHRMEGDNPDLVALLEEARLEHSEEEHDLRQFLHEGDKGWDLWEYRIGKILPAHVVVAHVALNKCAWLLRERHGDRGPKECW